MNNIFYDYKNNIFNNKYIKKQLMTKTEINFYHILQYFNKDYIVQPQINLATVINKNDNNYNELFKNIDYGIFDKNYKLLLLIELNDGSHLRKERKIRDKKVKKICKECNIPLLTFYTWYSNKEDYVIKRINEELKKTIY